MSLPNTARKQQDCRDSRDSLGTEFVRPSQRSQLVYPLPSCAVSNPISAFQDSQNDLNLKAATSPVSG